MEIDETQRKHMKVKENLWNSMNIDENLSQPMKI